MTEESFKRKLTAILSADVEGYSRLMGEDEDATIRTLTSYRELMSTLIQKHRGRVVDSPGDNLLAEFLSVVDAVRCAVEIQEELRVRNAELPENRRMQFRIGINLGDVVEEQKRIYGDGVNIAARVEGLAEGGGICISGTVYDSIKNKLTLSYESLSEHTVKNIKEPVRVYRMRVGPGAGVKPSPRRYIQALVMAMTFTTLLGGCVTTGPPSRPWENMRPEKPEIVKAVENEDLKYVKANINNSNVNDLISYTEIKYDENIHMLSNYYYYIIDSKKDIRSSILPIAVRAQKKEITEYLFSLKVDPNSIWEAKQTNIVQKHRKEEYPEKDTNVYNLKKSTLLFAARWDINIVKKLIKRGADINAVDENGSNALHNSLNSDVQKKEIGVFLISNGININKRGYQNYTPLHIAASNGHYSFVEMLIDNRCELDPQDNDGDTPLINAAKGKHLKIVELLISKGAKTDIRNNSDKTVFDVLKGEEVSYQKIYDLKMLAKGIDPENVDISNLILLLTDEDWQIRSWAASKLSDFGSKANNAVPALMQVAINDNSSHVRKEAIIGFQKIGYTGNNLIKMLQKIKDSDSDSSIRKVASETLYKLQLTALSKGREVKLDEDYLKSGNAYFKKGKYTKAISEFRQLSNKSLAQEHLNKAHLARANYYCRIGKYKQAISDYLQIKNPPSKDLCKINNNMGVCLANTQQLNSAVNKFTLVIKESNGNRTYGFHGFYNRAVAWYKLGEKTKAKEDLKQAIKIDPSQDVKSMKYLIVR